MRRVWGRGMVARAGSSYLKRQAYFSGKAPFTGERSFASVVWSTRSRTTALHVRIHGVGNDRSCIQEEPEQLVCLQQPQARETGLLYLARYHECATTQLGKRGNGADLPCKLRSVGGAFAIHRWVRLSAAMKVGCTR
jgi:hypothetical protein